MKPWASVIVNRTKRRMEPLPASVNQHKDVHKLTCNFAITYMYYQIVFHFWVVHLGATKTQASRWLIIMFIQWIIASKHCKSLHEAQIILEVRISIHTLKVCIQHQMWKTSTQSPFIGVCANLVPQRNVFYWSYTYTFLHCLSWRNISRINSH